MLNDQTKNLAATYDRIAKDWMADHVHDTWGQKGLERFVSYLRPGAKVLDVGCAGGLKAVQLLEKGFDVTGIDISQRMIALAQLKVQELYGRDAAKQFHVADVRDLPLLGKKYLDGIFAQAVLLHIPKAEIPETLKIMHAALKSGGVVYAAVKAPNPGQAEEEVKQENDYGYPYQRFFSFYTLDEMKKLFAEAGFSEQETWEDLAGHTTWVQGIWVK